MDRPTALASFEELVDAMLARGVADRGEVVLRASLVRADTAHPGAELVEGSLTPTLPAGTVSPRPDAVQFELLVQGVPTQAVMAVSAGDGVEARDTDALLT